MARRKSVSAKVVRTRKAVPTVVDSDFIGDGFTNVVNGLGTSKDNRTVTQYGLNLITPDQLLTAYRSNWLARRIVDCFAEDATREWRTWQASEEQVEKLEEAEKQLGVQNKIRQAIVRARLFGGAAIVMGIDNTGDLMSPLDLEAVAQDSLKFLLVLSSYEMSRGQLITDVTNEFFGRPEYYQINTGRAEVNKDALAQIHPSRVIEFIGSEIPSWDVVNGGSTWGDSVLQSVDDVIKDYGMSLASIAQMISDGKVDVFKIPGLTKKMANAGYEAAITRRVALSHQMKSAVNAMLMDEAEEWERVQTTFTGIPQMMAELLKVVSGASGIPMTRLVGHGSGSGTGKSLGGASGGESDLRNYYDEVTAKQKNDYSLALAPFDEVLERSALGTYDDTIYYEWTPLYTPDPGEEAQIALQKAQVFASDVGTGLINPDVLRKARINQLVEDAFYPGLQDAVDEFGDEPEEVTPTPDDINAHLGMLQQSSKQLQQIGKQAQPMLPKPPAKAPAKK